MHLNEIKDSKRHIYCLIKPKVNENILTNVTNAEKSQYLIFHLEIHLYLLSNFILSFRISFSALNST